MTGTVLQALGNLGEFVGALGVVVSLVYLARQMQQNTTSVRAASFNSMSENSIRLLEHAFRDSEFASFLARAEGDPTALSPAERIRWDAYMTAVFRHFGNLVFQYRVGALDRQMWESYERTLKAHLRTPSWMAWYEGNGILFSDALCSEVQKLKDELDAERALP
ncbi:MAG: hypothetical protein OEZ65_05290 [Gemmatimonadota bacterium]|nr:hypothetical protein [Gemmatimonadota bacterium]